MRVSWKFLFISSTCPGFIHCRAIAVPSRHSSLFHPKYSRTLLSIAVSEFLPLCNYLSVGTVLSLLHFILRHPPPSLRVGQSRLSNAGPEKPELDEEEEMEIVAVPLSVKWKFRVQLCGELVTHWVEFSSWAREDKYRVIIEGSSVE